MKIKLTPEPWISEIYLDPKEIQRLIEERAFKDYQVRQSGENRFDLNESADHFSLDDKRRVRACMQKLSNLEQALLYFRFWKDLLPRDITKLFKIPEEAVISIIEKALSRLRWHFKRTPNEHVLPRYLWSVQ